MGNKASMKLNAAGINSICQKTKIAVEQTAEETTTNIKKAGTIPFDKGTLQSNTFWEKDASKQNKVLLISNTPYARRLYFHPEYNFRTTNNENAGGRWFDTYVDGDKKEFVAMTFAKIMRRLMGK